MFVSPFSWYSFQGYLLNVYSWKKNTLLYMSKLQSENATTYLATENHRMLFDDSHNPTLSQMLYYYNKLQGAGGALFSTKYFSGLTTTPSLQIMGICALPKELI